MRAMTGWRPCPTSEAADGFGRRRKTLRGLMPDAVVDAAR